MAGNPTPPQLDAFLAGLRQVESGGNYDEQNGQGGYQILQSNWPTWAKRYAGYETTDPNASDAPPYIQDEVARGAVTADYYGRGQQDWTKVAEIWNGGEPYPVPNPALGPGATTADYAARVLKAMGDPQAAQAAAAQSGTAGTGSAPGVNLTGNDWITTLDGILNPDMGGGFSLNPAKDLGDVAKTVELLGVRIGFAMLGIIMFGGGLLLAFGGEIFGGKVAAVPGVGEFAGAAGAAGDALTVKGTRRRERGARIINRENEDTTDDTNDDEREAA